VIAVLLGGIGLFLVGMILLTEGLKEAAGEALRDLLARFTRTPAQALLSGAMVTALVQSSSATILTTIGFVSAGLLTLAQAIGVILGAAVGTTSTGWIVAVLGLKYSITAVALPLVGVGALLRLLGRGRWAAVGISLAGFGLIFVGIDTLQAGMEGLAARFDLAGLGHAGVLDRLWLVLIGLAMTVVMQSSSAAVATTLTALYAGAIGLEQAAMLVIGQNVGTAVTSTLAAIGASVPARRAAVAHVAFNLFAGTLALLAIPLYLPALHGIAAGVVDGGDAIAIATFHTAFNVVAVALVLPFAARLAETVGRIIPDPFPSPTRNLDPSVARLPAVAVEAARGAVAEIGGHLASTAAQALAHEPATPSKERMRALHDGLEEVRRFLARVRTSPDVGDVYARHVSVLHAADHLDRLARALRDAPPAPDRRSLVARAPVVERAGREVGAVAGVLEAGGDAAAGTLAAIAAEVAATRRERRPQTLAATASGERDARDAATELDTMRWADRLVYHLWRAAHHLGPGLTASGP
jgi:phosphate:Na+ symporter